MKTKDFILPETEQGSVVGIRRAELRLLSAVLEEPEEVILACLLSRQASSRNSQPADLAG